MTSSPKMALLEMPVDATDRKVALLIADYLLESDRIPYRFGINHDVRPPKMMACPMHYDWYRRGTVGIDTRDRAFAKRWLTEAAYRGYTVSRYLAFKPDGYSSSIARARLNAGYHRQPKDDDDAIPF